MIKLYSNPSIDNVFDNWFTNDTKNWVNSLVNNTVVGNNIGNSSFMNKEKTGYEFALTGFNKDEITIDLNERLLTISAESKRENAYSKSIKYSTYVSKDFSLDNPNINYENGLLSIIFDPIVEKNTIRRLLIT